MSQGVLARNHVPPRIKTETPDESVRSVQRALGLLCGFGPERPRATLTEIVQQSGLPLTTVSRLLGTLETVGFVRRLSDGGYGLGVRVLQLGLAARSTFDVIDLAEATLVRLNELTGENTSLAVRIDDQHFMYIRQIPSRHPVRHTSWVGRQQPLSGTANGSALLGKVGVHGYVTTRKTFEPDVTAAAAPIYGVGGEILAAISITGPTYRITDAKLRRHGKLLHDAARRLSQDFLAA